MSKLLIAAFLILGISSFARAEESDFDVVETPEKVAPASAAPAETAKPEAAQAVVTPTTQVADARKPASAPSAGFFCGPATEHNLSSTLSGNCRTDSPFSFSTSATGLVYCCVHK